MTLDKMKAITELEDYKEACKRHDWTYEYSDDFRWYSSGKAVERILKALAEEHGLDWKYAYNEAHHAAWGKNLKTYVAPYPEVWPF